jgi:hypothetical protein
VAGWCRWIRSSGACAGSTGQQRHTVPAFAFAVFKKFGDDQGGNLVALLTYFAFLATFPLLPALSGYLGAALRGDPSLQARIQTSALSEFPITGTQLKSQVGVSALGHSTVSLVVAILGAVLGGGLSRAAAGPGDPRLHVARLAPTCQPGAPRGYRVAEVGGPPASRACSLWVRSAGLADGGAVTGWPL